VFGEYVWRTYEEVHAEVLAVGSAIVSLGLAPESADPEPVCAATTFVRF
jgi:hypothetical protein